jgi:antitoxin HicB
MERFEYPVLLKRAAEGGYVVTCRDLPALITQGESKDDALAQAADAMDEVLATVMKLGLDLPPPSKPRRAERLVSPPVETVAKAALYSALRDAKITKTELAKQLGVDEKEVRRLLDPHYGSKLPRIAEAVALLGKRLVVSLEST